MSFFKKGCCTLDGDETMKEMRRCCSCVTPHVVGVKGRRSRVDYHYLMSVNSCSCVQNHQDRIRIEENHKTLRHIPKLLKNINTERDDSFRSFCTCTCSLFYLKKNHSFRTRVESKHMSITMIMKEMK